MTYVGRVAHEKNIEFLVKVFAKVRETIPDAMLVIAGEGPARESLRQLVARLGLDADVHFAGYLDRNTGLLDCYAAANVFVFASRTETQGLVLLEAMAQGAPVVSTAELGTRSILKPGCGALVVEEQAGRVRGGRRSGPAGPGPSERSRRARSNLCADVVVRHHGAPTGRPV